ncbi:MAG: 4a-hydroxytetrahydrobiopterin dehydratase [Microbacteriaceae bacterium]|nr:4a-hydroxytetrahydrobiopterin dehydratase [Microbacteriaceae bacterium]
MAKSTLVSSDTAERLAGTAFTQLDGVLYGAYTTKDFAGAAAIVAEVSRAAEAANHHPEARLGWGRVDFALTSHDAGGVTERDVALAEQIEAVAIAGGGTPVADLPKRFEIAIDTVNPDGIRDFWRVGLGYEERTSEGETTLVDPDGLAPTLWFQLMDPPRIDRNRIHLDVYVPTANAEPRVRAILEAGGVLMTDEHAPDWWVLSDAEGNELCVCTAE